MRKFCKILLIVMAILVLPSPVSSDPEGFNSWFHSKWPWRLKCPGGFYVMDEPGGKIKLEKEKEEWEKRYQIQDHP